MPKLNAFWKRWIFLGLIIILFFMVMTLNSSISEYFRLTDQRNIQPGDQMIIPVSPVEATQEINYLQTPTPSSEDNWQIWWELFFGE